MTVETPKEAALRLAAKPLAKGFEFEALHEYCDAEGKALFWRIRLKNFATGEKWIRPLRINEQGVYVLSEPPFANGKPLYRLAEMSKNPEAVIWIVEGEWCADALANLGLMAITSGAADSARKADWSTLTNRRVIIWRDNDDAGLRYAREVTERLQKLNCVVQWIAVEQLSLEPKEDCVDWLAVHRDANREMIEALACEEPITRNMHSRKPSAAIEEQCDIADTSPLGFLVLADGVYYVDDKGRHLLCSPPLYVKAWVRDSASENWGRLLEFCDPDGCLHRWVMPMEMLKGSGEDIKGHLSSQGLIIQPGYKNRQHLLTYITNCELGSQTRARCVTHTGWYGEVFVLPEQTIGNASELVVYQGEYLARHYQQAGTLEAWQNNIAKYCAGNSRLVMAIACAFAALLLHPAKMESGGIHFVGASSSGKTTALRVAASVFGAANYMNRWRATSNGLEALAALHSDTLLILDELSQADAKEVGEMTYMLSNGSGKARASRTGAARARHEWRTLILSAGEITLNQHMREVGKKARAGQEVRLIDVPADAGKGLGVFENLHDAANSAQLSQQLVDATATTYGMAAVAFLEAVTKPNHFAQLVDFICHHRDAFLVDNLPSGSSAQVQRACKRFALIAAAGELATCYGITGWPQDEATTAATVCFQAALELRGGIGNQEDANILAQVQSIFEAHGSSRFEELSPFGREDANRHNQSLAFNQQRIVDRLGFKRVTGNNDVEYFVFPQAFKEELCKGFEVRYCAQLLISAGMLKPNIDGRSQTPHRINGVVKKLYHFVRAEPA